MQAERTYYNLMKIIDFDEEVFIPFVSDEEDEFSSLQQVWNGDEEVFKQLNATNENEE